jgi:hypothetical protein
MDLQKWVVGFVLFGLFTLALIGFAMNFAADNGSAVDISSDSQIVALYAGTSQNLSVLGAASETSTNSIINSSIAFGGQTTQTGGQFAITPASAVGIGKNVIQVGYYKIFGTGSGFGIFFFTLMGLITFISGLMIWKAWVGRQPSD